jgi:hypothetical protein
MQVTDDRAQRIENQLAELTRAVQRLILIDERQIEQGKRMGILEERVGGLEKDHAVLSGRLSQYFWFVLGIAGTLTTILTLSQMVLPLLQYFTRK